MSETRRSGRWELSGRTTPAGGTGASRSRWRRDGGAWGAEDGNTLILMPVAVLILLLLGATALDGAIVLMADRELNDVASGLANDAASLIDDEAFYRDGTVRISQDRVDALVAQMVPLLQDDPLEFTCVGRVAPSDDRVTVTCRGRTDLVFLPALPAAGTLGDVEASATARAEAG